jgi:hypothetical protein
VALARWLGEMTELGVGEALCVVLAELTSEPELLTLGEGLAREVALLLEVTSRSANSNEIKQFKMMLKIYHNDN